MSSMIYRSLTLVGCTLVMLTARALATDRFVNVNSASPAPPYTNWAMAASTIQDAIDASEPGDQIIVTNGLYQTGGRVAYNGLTNRIALTTPMTVTSVNGPEVTVIEGYPIAGDSAVRCAYLTNGARLIGFTLTNGATLSQSLAHEAIRDFCGGGVWCESTDAVISNCIITANAAQPFWYGGGAFSGTLENCILRGNSAFGGGGGCSNVLKSCMIVSNSAFSPWGDGEGGGVAGGILSNCILSGNSSYGGGGAVACTLTGCTLSFNSAGWAGGGGAANCTLNNCMVKSNAVAEDPSGSFSLGGGAHFSTLNNCQVVGNTSEVGGGVAFSTLNNCLLLGNSAYVAGGNYMFPNYGMTNCTVVGNSAEYGGGINVGTVHNCILFDNISLSDPAKGNYIVGTFINCCTFPAPTDGQANITNAPLFVDAANGDFHLQANSPCINSGGNSFMPLPTDLDGNPRIRGSTVDIGAYEVQSPASTISYAWLQQFGLPTDGSADFTDVDGDTMNNWQEWRAQTNPTNTLSLLKITSLARTNSSWVVSWQSVSGLNYFLQRGNELSAQPPFSVLQSDLVGQDGITSFADTNAMGAGPIFYRVGVQ